MDTKLKTFLRTRNIAEETIDLLYNENIDAKAIHLMDDQKLSEYFPKYGDRIIIRDFCKEHLPSTKKDTLLEKLRKKIRYRKEEPNDSSEGELTGETKHCSKRKKNAVKEQRQIELGWFCSLEGNVCKQVRTKHGGGTRKIAVSKESTKRDILERAIKLFFPGGISTKGPIDRFSFELWDFKSNTIKDDITVAEMFNITSLSRLRFYLVTKEKTETLARPPDESETETHDSGLPVIPVICPPLAIETSIDTSPTLLNYYNGIDDNDFSPSFIDNEILNDIPIVVSDQDNTICSTIFDNHMLVSNNDIINDISTGPTKLLLHRGQCFDELIEAFSTLEKNCGSIQIEMYQPNGTKEVGYDSGGIFRDALSEFWQSFYDKCTTGADFRVPMLRHDFDEKKWRSIAKIFFKGWQEERYFPLKLAPAFVEQCFYGCIKSDLIKQFLIYLNRSDAEIIKTALDKWVERDEEELVNILDTLECKWQPSEGNISKIIYDIAHKELVQKPMFIIDAWRDTLKTMIDEQFLENIYLNYSPTPKNVLQYLTCNDDLDSNAVRVFGYLKKFIKEVDSNMLQLFLRFCTGSDILNGSNISVAFNENKGLDRTPIGRTCSSIIELSSVYENYPDFRTDMKLVLNSNIWIMDIV